MVANEVEELLDSYQYRDEYEPSDLQLKIEQSIIEKIGADKIGSSFVEHKDDQSFFGLCYQYFNALPSIIEIRKKHWATFFPSVIDEFFKTGILASVQEYDTGFSIGALPKDSLGRLLTYLFDCCSHDAIMEYCKIPDDLLWIDLYEEYFIREYSSILEDPEDIRTFIKSFYWVGVQYGQKLLAEARNK